MVLRGAFVEESSWFGWLAWSRGALPRIAAGFVVLRGAFVEESSSLGGVRSLAFQASE